MKPRGLRAQLELAEHELAREKRHAAALEEWFWCEGRSDCAEFDVVVNGSVSMRVLVRGLDRASGGVASLQCDGYRDLPRYLDDLILEMRSDLVLEVRDAAARIAAAREERNRIDRSKAS